MTQRSRKGSDEENESEMIEEENNGLFKGEESFMNSLHPFEMKKNGSEFKTSPIQRAIINCMEIHGGKATETQILDHVRSKWEIINKYSERTFKIEPTLRIIRLNCSIKKKSRHLFMKEPGVDDVWRMNIKKKADKSEEDLDASDQIDTPVPKSDDNLYFDIIPSFEDSLIEYLSNSKLPIRFDEIIKFAETIKDRNGSFDMLPLMQRTKACLISMKVLGKAFYDPIEQKWSSVPIQTEGKSLIVVSDIFSQFGMRIKDMSTEDLYNELKKKQIF